MALRGKTALRKALYALNNLQTSHGQDQREGTSAGRKTVPLPAAIDSHLTMAGGTLPIAGVRNGSVRNAKTGNLRELPRRRR